MHVHNAGLYATLLARLTIQVPQYPFLLDFTVTVNEDGAIQEYCLPTPTTPTPTPTGDPGKLVCTLAQGQGTAAAKEVIPVLLFKFILGNYIFRQALYI